MQGILRTTHNNAYCSIFLVHYSLRHTSNLYAKLKLHCDRKKSSCTKCKQKNLFVEVLSFGSFEVCIMFIVLTKGRHFDEIDNKVF